MNLFNYNPIATGISPKNTHYPIVKNKYTQDVFKKSNAINFTAYPKILLFEDIAKFIKNGELESIKKLADPHVINSEFQSLLHISAEEKQLEISKNLLVRGLDINQKDKMGRTPFAIACKNKDEPMINLFFDFNPKLNIQDDVGDTPLHHAIPNQNILESLLKKGANPYIRNDFGLPILHEAAENMETLEYLLKKGVNPNSINDEEQTLLHTAAMDGNTKLSDRLIDYDAEINFRDQEGKTPLFYAKNSDILSYFLAKNANPDIQDKKGRTIIHKLIMENNIKGATEVLEFFANPNILDKSKKSPILYATNNKIRKILLEYGADPNINTSDGSTLLHKAVQNNNETVSNTLLEYKADVNALDINKNSPLAYATSNKIRRILLENGANPDEKLYLHWALRTGNKEFFTDLLNAKADVNIEDAYGRTPIFYCRDTDEVIKLLKKNADMLHEDKNGNTPLHHYCAIGDTQIASLLTGLDANPKSLNSNGETPADLFAIYKQYDCWIK